MGFWFCITALRASAVARELRLLEEQQLPHPHLHRKQLQQLQQPQKLQQVSSCFLVFHVLPPLVYTST